MANPVLGDRYELQRQLGKNSGKRTLLARDLQTQTPVVIKLLPLDSETEWDDLKLFEREAEILQQLSHPAIPQYLHHFEINLRSQQKGFALVQTYIEGRSLEAYLRAGRVFSEAEAKHIAKSMLDILIYLHEQHPPVIHRDIKPSNILLTDGSGDRTHRVHLVDFGSVKTASAVENTTFTVVGTYGYMPPEQFSGRAIAASDLYSLSATLITLVTGTHPSSLPRQGLRIAFEQIVNLSPTFADWLSWLTEANLNRRPTSARQALQALEQGQMRNVKLKAEKPADSKINFTQTPEALEILIPTLLGHTKLRIDSQQITLTTKRLGLNANRPQVAPRQSIQKLEYNRPLTADAADTSTIPPHLIIWAGTQKYEFVESQALTEPELKWLAYELSTWLKLPISSS